MSQGIFITATDTDTGKTWVTNHLIQSLLKERANAKAIKPIACGSTPSGINDDVQLLLKSQGLQHATNINFYHFNQPAAPSIAAQAEGKLIAPKELQAWCKKQTENVDLCLVEAIGGLMVPLTPNYHVSDWLSDMPNMPVILIVGAKLGCINHALLSLSYLSSIDREPAWVIINNTDGRQDTSSIKEAILPYLSNASNILECGYNQPSDLSPISDYLQRLLHRKYS